VALAAVAARGPAATGPAAGVAAGGAVSTAIAACGPARPGLAAGAMAARESRLAAQRVSSCPRRLGIAAAWYLNKKLKQ
jgi:hypothetical protein